MEKADSLTILEVITKSSEYLARKSVPNYKTDAEWLIAFALGCKRMDLYLRYGEVLNSIILNKIKSLIMQRGKRVPLQHILGQVQFAGLTLKSDRRGLVPRSETEFLVDYLYQKYQSDFKGKIADLGCGSGAIILSLCSLMPHSKGCGFDKSKEALSLANENLDICKLGDRVHFKSLDWTQETQLYDNFDLIVSNPPYLSHSEWMSSEPEVQEYDPFNALVSEKNGYSDIEFIVELAKNALQRGGALALEFGADQAESVSDLLSTAFEVKIVPDQHLVRRFAFAVKK